MIKVKKADLAFALRAVTRLMDSNPTMPILKFTKLLYMEKFLYIDAGNPSDHAFARIPAEGDPTVGCVDPRILLQLLPSLGEEIVMTPHKNKLLIKRPTGNVLLATADPELYPPNPPAKEAGDWILFPREGIKELCASLLCGTEEDGTLPTLWQNVALLRCGGEEYVAVSSDGRRTAVVDGVCQGEAGLELLIPVKALRALYALVDSLPESVTTIKIGQDKNRIWIYLGDCLRLTYGKIHTQFPDVFGQVLAKLQFTRKLEVNSEAVAGALNLVKIMGDDKTRAFRMEASAESMLFATASADRGEGSELVSVASPNGFESFTTGYNVDFLAPIFQQIDGTVTVEFAETGKGRVDYPLKVVYQGANVRSSWLIASLNIFPKAEVKE